jgi:hypothetical protein
MLAYHIVDMILLPSSMIVDNLQLVDFIEYLSQANTSPVFWVWIYGERDTSETSRHYLIFKLSSLYPSFKLNSSF